jgi:hypothetical protein
MSDDPFIMHLSEGGSACPRCGYDLSGLREAVCPECGSRLRLGVELAERRRGRVRAEPWVQVSGFFVGTLTLCLGVNLVTVGWGVWLAATPGPPGWAQMWPVVALSGVWGAGTAVVLRHRGRVRERCRTARTSESMVVVWGIGMALVTAGLFCFLLAAR